MAKPQPGEYYSHPIYGLIKIVENGQSLTNSGYRLVSEIQFEYISNTKSRQLYLYDGIGKENFSHATYVSDVRQWKLENL